MDSKPRNLAPTRSSSNRRRSLSNEESLSPLRVDRSNRVHDGGVIPTTEISTDFPRLNRVCQGKIHPDLSRSAIDLFRLFDRRIVEFQVIVGRDVSMIPGCSSV